MVKVKQKANSNRGAPVKDKDKRVDPVYHLYMWQTKRMEEEARIRGKSTSAMIRDGIDWFITALDTGRADVTASKLFDDTMKEYTPEQIAETIRAGEILGVGVKFKGKDKEGLSVDNDGK